MASAAPSYRDSRAAALRVVSAAHRITRHVQGGGESADVAAASKADASPVTVADYAVQAFVTLRLSALFPGDAFIAEETSAALRASPPLLAAVAGAVRVGLGEAVSGEEVVAAIDRAGAVGGDGKRTWVLDPIDGTRGFVAKRQYCIALALTDGGVPVVGVLGCPSLPVGAGGGDGDVGVLFHAIAGEGAYSIAEGGAARGELGDGVRVDTACNLAGAVFCESVERGHSSHELSARVAGLLGIKRPPARMDSQAKYGAMSRGEFHIFMRFPRGGYVENVWDHAAGVVVLEEAGGRVSDGRGRSLDFSKGRFLDNDDGIVASNGDVHDAVIDAVQQAIREQKAAEAESKT